MKKHLAFLAAVIVLSSCADTKTFEKKDGTSFTAKPYGWANCDSKKIEGVIYEVNIENILLDLLFCDTAIIPICLTGWQFYEPVRYEETIEQ